MVGEGGKGWKTAQGASGACPTQKPPPISTPRTLPRSPHCRIPSPQPWRPLRAFCLEPSAKPRTAAPGDHGTPTDVSRDIVLDGEQGQTTSLRLACSRHVLASYAGSRSHVASAVVKPHQPRHPGQEGLAAVASKFNAQRRCEWAAQTRQTALPGTVPRDPML